MMSFSKLDRALILSEALSLLNEEGLKNVSLRKIAAKLDVSVSALYWHVKDKQELYALMSLSIFQECLDRIPPVSDWRQWLHSFGMVLWDAQLSIKDAHQLIMVTRAGSNPSGGGITPIIRELTHLGLDQDVAMLAQRSVQAMATGWTTLGTAVPTHFSERQHFSAALDILIQGWSIAQSPNA